MRPGGRQRSIPSRAVDTDRLTSPEPSVPAVGTRSHSRAVARQADLLVNRLLAIKALGTLAAELQGLDGPVPPVGGQA